MLEIDRCRTISVTIALILAILCGSVADAAQKKKKTFLPGKARGK